ncbi:MAG TPA: hypothetical protein DCY88_19175, partial [Cyanobacteria bacterium UBA11372]|nr:hypothetical protein [Cyanobacteria bacterium UBA11372]
MPCPDKIGEPEFFDAHARFFKVSDRSIAKNLVIYHTRMTKTRLFKNRVSTNSLPKKLKDDSFGQFKDSSGGKVFPLIRAKKWKGRYRGCGTEEAWFILTNLSDLKLAIEEGKKGGDRFFFEPLQTQRTQREERASRSHYSGLHSNEVHRKASVAAALILPLHKRS